MRSKGLAAWLAVLLGALGAHRFYLRGFGDLPGHAHWPVALLSLWGLRDVGRLGTNAEGLTWALPLACTLLAAACLQGIVIALTSDERWLARHGQAESGGWGAVLAAVLGLLLGGASLMTAIAYGAQRYFELSS